MPRLVLILSALLCCAWLPQPTPTPAPPQYAWNVIQVAGGPDTMGMGGTPTATPTPGNTTLYFQDFEDVNDEPSDTFGTVNDDCITSTCPLNGVQSLSVGPSGDWNRWIKDNVFTNRQSGCVSMTIYTEAGPSLGYASTIYLRTDGANTDDYAVQLEAALGASDDWKVWCNDTSAVGGDYVLDTSYTVVLDIDMANGVMDFYLDGASTPTVSCDGSSDVETFDGINLLSKDDNAQNTIFDDVVICDSRTVSGVCSCN